MDVVMPQLGETVAEGKVSTWFKAQGDRVEAGENLFEIETDKVTMEVQALTSGVLSEVRVKSGEVVPVGAVVAVIGEGAAASASPSWEGVRGGEPPQRPEQHNGRTFKMAPFAETNTPTRNYGKATGANGMKITPLARRLIEQSGIDVSVLAEKAKAKAKGAWRIGKADVEAALKEPSETRRHPAPSPSPQGGGEARTGDRPERDGRVVFNTIRRQTAERLAEAWRTIPHVTQAVEVDFSAVEKARQARKGDFKTRHGTSLTYLPFIARAVCIAVADFPRVNARLDGDGLVLSPDINLGIAVDLSHEGLVVPVLKHADELTAGGLAKPIGRLVERARSKALAPDDFAGGTYTISNNGSFGTLLTTPIINAPQVAILSADAIRKKAVVVESEGGDSIAIRPIGVLAQSFDHRAFDGAYSAAFLARVKGIIETRDWAGELT